MKIFFLITTALLMTFAAQAQNRSRSGSTPAAYSFASNTQHEVVISPSKISVENYKAEKKRTDVSVYLAYNHHLQNNIQLGGEGGLLVGEESDGDSKALVAALGVFTWNFNSNLRESFFVNGGAGLYPAYDKDDGDIDSKISFFGGGGKRFEMWGKINYMPYARVWKRGDEDVRLELQALNFSIFY